MMGRIAAELADVAIVTSDNPRSEDPQAIIDEIVAGRRRRRRGRARPRARRSRARSSSRATATSCVIAGKGHEQGQEFADRTVPFDDREVGARGAARARERRT